MHSQKTSKKETFVLSLGGSIICPNTVDVGFLRNFRKLILENKGKRFIITCGGGKLARNYISYANVINKLHSVDNDEVGIMATRLNAELVRGIFSDYAHKKVVYDPDERVKFDNILITAGNKPGTSSDFDAVLLAGTYGAKEVINLTNVDYVYDKDPKKYGGAKPFRELTWGEFRKLVGGQWKAGMNSPFDPIASKAAEKEGLKVVVLNGRNLKNFDAYLKGKPFKGTIIH